MTPPRLFSVWFRSSSPQYPRLARVLEMTARRHCPTWEIDVRQVDPPAVLRGKDGSESAAANHHKLVHWKDAVCHAPLGARLLLVDADTFVTAPLDPLWDREEFDIAYTERTKASRYPLNGGVVAVRVTDMTRDFMRYWVDVDGSFLRDPAARAPYRQKYGGQNQASFGYLLERPPLVRIVPLPCAEWNCEDTSWHLFSSSTRIVHVKSALRMACFDMVSYVRLKPLARMWKALDAEAQQERAQAQAVRS